MERKTLEALIWVSTSPVISQILQTQEVCREIIFVN